MEIVASEEAEATTNTTGNVCVQSRLALGMDEVLEKQLIQALLEFVQADSESCNAFLS